MTLKITSLWNGPKEDMCCCWCGISWLAAQGYYLGRTAVAPSQSMSFQCAGPTGPSGNPHIGSLPAHGGGTGTSASNNHPGARYRRYKKGMANSTVSPPPPPQHLPEERETEHGAGSCRGVLYLTLLFSSLHKVLTYHSNESSRNASRGRID